jgi:hypothetical protein
MKSFKNFTKLLNEANNNIDVPDFIIEFLNENNIPKKYKNIILNIIYKQILKYKETLSIIKDETEFNIRIKKIYKWLLRDYIKNDTLNKILVFLKEDNKPILNIKKLETDDFFSKLNQFNQIRDWSIATNTNVKNMIWEDAIDKAEEWHQSLKANGGKIENEKGYIKYKYDDGYYWIDLQTCKDSEEAYSMGHCGVAQEGNILYSLRKNKIPHITLEYNPKNKHIIQCRGGANSKPKEKYHKYIVDFIIGNVVNIVETPFYKSNDNFSLNDLSKELLQKLFIQADGLNVLQFFNINNCKEYIIDDLYRLISKQNITTDEVEILKKLKRLSDLISMYVLDPKNINIVINNLRLKQNRLYLNDVIKKLEDDKYAFI